MRAVQLPNGDLWLGRKQTDRPDTLDTKTDQTPDDMVAEMLKSQKGEILTCLHCSQQFTRKQLNELYEHVETLHPSASKTQLDAAALEGQLAVDPENVEILAQLDGISLK
jgi:hypothetical protein